MEFGIAVASPLDSWKVVKRAEELGFSHAWFYDTQMLSPDIFATMALAAVNTKKIKLGSGVLVSSNRIAPVAANGMASLNSSRRAASFAVSAPASRRAIPWGSDR